MQRRRTWWVWVSILALLGGACGGAATNASGSGNERTVLIDYKHDEFAGSFLHYYPSNITVRPGDTVRFAQAWSGEPHSVTMGKVVDDAFTFLPLLEKYDSEEAALAGGVAAEKISEVKAAMGKLPGMTGKGNTIYQPGAQPCFVPNLADVPAFSDGDEKVNEDARCPTEGKHQPAFTGRQGLYNSGFIPYQGAKGNTFRLPIANDASPGTYRYFCNFHWVSMSGTVEIVAKDTPIPSQATVSRQARKEIAHDATAALGAVRKGKKGLFGAAKPPVIGLSTGNDKNGGVSVNEFLPARVDAQVGKPVTWSSQGFAHTISFRVPKYFPVFAVAKKGTVTWDEKSYEPVGWKVPPAPEGHGPPGDGQHRTIDVGKWDGSGGFHSSGLLGFGDTFTVTFTKPGTYPFACVLHPPMVGTLVVK